MFVFYFRMVCPHIHSHMSTLLSSLSPLISDTSTMVKDCCLQFYLDFHLIPLFHFLHTRVMRLILINKNKTNSIQVLFHYKSTAILYCYHWVLATFIMLHSYFYADVLHNYSQEVIMSTVALKWAPPYFIKFLTTVK